MPIVRKTDNRRVTPGDRVPSQSDLAIRLNSYNCDGDQLEQGTPQQNCRARSRWSLVPEFAWDGLGDRQLVTSRRSKAGISRTRSPHHIQRCVWRVLRSERKIRTAGRKAARRLIEPDRSVPRRTRGTQLGASSRTDLLDPKALLFGPR